MMAAAKLDLNQMMKKVKDFFKNIPENIKKLPEKIKAFIEKVKKAPVDEQAAYGAIGFGSLLFIIGIVFIIIT